MATHVLWSGGGEAEFVLIDGDRVELRSTEPFAPGSRPAGRLAVAPDQEIWVKVHRSRREDAPRFHVWGRLLNVTRPLRAHLDALSVASSPAVHARDALRPPAEDRSPPASCAPPSSGHPSCPAVHARDALRPPAEDRSPPASCAPPSSSPGPSGPATDIAPRTASTALAPSPRQCGDDKESSS